MSHYILPLTEYMGPPARRVYKAGCGRFVESAEHSSEPTCRECVAFCEADAEAVETLDAPAEFAPAPPRPESDVVGEYERYMDKKYGGGRR